MVKATIEKKPIAVQARLFLKLPGTPIELSVVFQSFLKRKYKEENAKVKWKKIIYTCEAETKKYNAKMRENKKQVRRIFFILKPRYALSKYPHLPQDALFLCSASLTPAPHFGQFLPFL